jgi:hypothetical protein
VIFIPKENPEDFLGIFCYILATPVSLAVLTTALATTFATLLSKAGAMIFSSVISSSGIKDAKAKEVATFISSLMQVALQSRAPLKIPGKAKTLFI